MVESACVQFQGDLKGFLLGVLKNRDLAEDVFQKTAIRAMEAAENARAATLRGWLFQIALNEARQLLRQKKGIFIITNVMRSKCLVRMQGVRRMLVVNGCRIWDWLVMKR